MSLPEPPVAPLAPWTTPFSQPHVIFNNNFMISFPSTCVIFFPTTCTAWRPFHLYENVITLEINVPVKISSHSVTLFSLPLSILGVMTSFPSACMTSLHTFLPLYLQGIYFHFQEHVITTEINVPLQDVSSHLHTLIHLRTFYHLPGQRSLSTCGISLHLGKM